MLEEVNKKRVAIVATHPIQYYSPWFKVLANDSALSVKVFYLWEAGVTEQVDQGFKHRIKWDIPLLDGYQWEFVVNSSRRPGTHHFFGLINPSLERTVKCFEPDAVLLMGYNFFSMIQFLCFWRSSRAPLLLRGDSHRIIGRCGIKERFRKALISLLFRRFSGFLYVGKANRRYFLYHGVAEERLFYAPHAIDNQRFCSACDNVRLDSRRWKTELGIPSDHQVVLFAGKWETKKRPVDLLEAFLLAAMPKSSLVFVGAGHLEEVLRNRASNHPFIKFAPFQNQSQMPRTYGLADLFVLPSYGEGETWGLAVNEAMCLGCPIIVSTHVGCAEDLVKPYHNGLIFEAGNIPVLAKCLQEALSDRERLKKWGRNSRVDIVNCNYEKVTQGLKQALSKVCV